MSISASRIFHVNSNCRDIERSLGFYRDVLGFTASTHPLPNDAQPGAAFGLDEVLWDGWILQGDLGYGGISLDLLEWKVPLPGGRPPHSINEPGLHRLCFVVPDLEATLAAVRAEGLHVLGVSALSALVLDPDGVPVQLAAGTDRRISHLIVNCCDLDVSVAYYCDVLGLVVDLRAPSATQDPQLYGLACEVKAVSVRCVDVGSGLVVELVHFIEPPMPAATERHANDIGLVRMAWSTSNCAAARPLFGPLARCHSHRRVRCPSAITCRCCVCSFGQDPTENAWN